MSKNLICPIHYCSHVPQTKEQTCFINDNRFSLDRGDGLDFIFTLSNPRQEDVGVYEIVIEGTHPATSSLITIKEIFHLDIGRS